jgi:hypothetical protein
MRIHAGLDPGPEHWVCTVLRIRIGDPVLFLTPGSGMEKIRTRDKHPGSATLGLQIFFDRLL